MTRISTLITDIYHCIQSKDGWFTQELASQFSDDVALRLQASLNQRTDRPSLRLSQMGPRCPCALWHSIHRPELAIKFKAPELIKFSYGHILEALAITLAKASGHTVTGEQDELSVDGVLGHRDCVIDGCVCDVKSCSPIQFEKYASGMAGQNDSFGYLDQLDGYICGSLGDPLVTVKDRGYILAIHKVLGKVALYEHTLREAPIRARIKSYKEIVGRDTAPPCECGRVPEGLSGNIKLDVRASYDPFKYVCNPGLRTFLYEKGPVYLTRVVKLPKVPEVDKDGNPVDSYR